jgi:hypothetical protein
MSRKYKKYEKIILEVLTEIASSNAKDSVQDIVISDTKKHHYQILHTGWFTPEQFVYQIIIHFQIMESGKVWLLANNTDNPITEELVRRGIPPSEIVLGFQPPLFRSVSGYAVN